jgi:hypothetical protein
MEFIGDVILRRDPARRGVSARFARPLGDPSRRFNPPPDRL